MKNDWRVGAQIVTAGAIGGLASWVIQIGLGAKGFGGFSWQVAVPAVMLLGAVAAFLGVYLIANSDTTARAHTLGFALACGIFWQPVIESTQAFVNRATAERTVSKLDQASDKLRASLSNQNGNVDAGVSETSANAKTAVREIQSAADPAVRSELVAKSQEAIQAITEASGRTPTVGVDALEGVGMEAVKSGQTEIAKTVVNSLQTVGTNKPDDTLVTTVSSSLDDISRQARSSGFHALAADTELARGEVVVKAASGGTSPTVVGGLAKTVDDLSAAEQFYKATGQNDKAASAATLRQTAEQVLKTKKQ